MATAVTASAAVVTTPRTTSPVDGLLILFIILQFITHIYSGSEGEEFASE